MKKRSKKEIKELQDKLLYKRRHTFSQMKRSELKALERYCREYMEFLDHAKTERLAAAEIVKAAERHGFSRSPGTGAGTRRWWEFRGKFVALAVMGRRPVTDGVRIIVSHIDAPRLDLKINPLYEEMDMAYMKTHYYGGIKKFQWVTRPLALHGVVVKDDGKTVPISIGEEQDDPVLVINDLLPHLAQRVQDKKLREAIPAEKLNILVGGIPLPRGEEAEKAVKLHVLEILNRKFGITERDFVSAEIEAVPAGRAREVGLDRAFVGGYGQDDRSCAFASLKAILNTKAPPHTSICLFVDKEEIGSDGNTGAKSLFLHLVMEDLLEMDGSSGSVARSLARSLAISADVTSAVDPDYMEVHEKNNNAWCGYGVNLTKYTGARGKYSANDAHAEYLGFIRRAWNRGGVVWQAGTMGRVDEGGGGTVAKYLAQHGINVVDAGTPLLSMHAPFEIAHKGDLFMTYRGYAAFFAEEGSHEDH